MLQPRLGLSKARNNSSSEPDRDRLYPYQIVTGTGCLSYWRCDTPTLANLRPWTHQCVAKFFSLFEVTFPHRLKLSSLFLITSYKAFVSFFAIDQEKAFPNFTFKFSFIEGYLHWNRESVYLEQTPSKHRIHIQSMIMNKFFMYNF